LADYYAQNGSWNGAQVLIGGDDITQGGLMHGGGPGGQGGWAAASLWPTQRECGGRLGRAIQRPVAFEPACARVRLWREASAWNAARIGRRAYGYNDGCAEQNFLDASIALS